MKAVKFVFGTLAALYTLVAGLRLVEVLTVGPGSGASSGVVPRLVPVALGAAIAISLFKSALGPPQSGSPDPSDDTDDATA